MCGGNQVGEWDAVDEIGSCAWRWRSESTFSAIVQLAAPFTFSWVPKKTSTLTNTYCKHLETENLEMEMEMEKEKIAMEYEREIRLLRDHQPKASS